MSKPISILILFLSLSSFVHSQDTGQYKTSVFRIVKPKAQDTFISEYHPVQFMPYMQDTSKMGKVWAEIHNVTTNHYIYVNSLIATGIIDVKDSSKWKVISFDLDISAYDVLNADSNNIDTKLSGSFHSDDGRFSKTMLKAIRKAKQGKFKFSNIVALNSSGHRVNLDELVVYVYATPGIRKSRNGIQP